MTEHHEPTQKQRFPWRQVLYPLAGLMCAFALLLLLLQLLLPLAARYPHIIAHELQRELDIPVTLGSMHGSWHVSGPQLEIKQVQLGHKAPALAQAITVKVDLGSFFSSSRRLLSVHIEKPQLIVLRQQDAWYVADYELGREPLHIPWIARLPGVLTMDALDLSVIADEDKPPRRLYAQQLRLDSNMRQWRFAARLNTRTQTEPLPVAGYIDTNGTDGMLWFKADDVVAIATDIMRVEDPQQQGRLGAEAWLEWQDLTLAQATVAVESSALRLRHDEHDLAMPDTRQVVHYRRQDDAHAVHIHDLGGGDLSLHADTLRKPQRIRLDAQAFDLTPWLMMMAAVPDAPPSVSHWLRQAAPRAHVAQGQIVWQRETGIEHLQADIVDVHSKAVGDMPGVAMATMHLAQTDDGVTVNWDKQPLELDFGHMFRQPLNIPEFSGTVHVQTDAQTAKLQIAAMQFAGDDFAGDAAGHMDVPLNGALPSVDIDAQLTHGEIAAASRFWPVAVMSDNLVEWLDHALVSGQVEAATMRLKGDLARWPFTDGGGEFVIDADVNNAVFDYYPGWPRAHDVQARVRFINNSMFIESQQVRVDDIAIKTASATIDDLSDVELAITAAGQASAQAMLNYVIAAPFAADYASELQHLTLDGSGEFALDLSLPLEDDNPEDNLQLDGKVTLAPTRIRAPEWSVDIERVNGHLVFDQNGLRAPELDGSYQQQPVKLDLEAGTVAGHPTWPVRVGMQGRFSAQELAAAVDGLELDDTVSTGRAPFRVLFHVDEQADNPLRQQQVLSLTSDLSGMALTLPPPLQKPAQKQQGFHLAIGLDQPQKPLLYAELDHLLRARAAIDTAAQDMRLGVQLGDDEHVMPTLPAKGIVIEGHVKQLALSQWIGRVLDLNDDVDAVDDASSPLTLAIRGDQVELLGASFDDTSIRITRDAQRVRLQADGPAVSGQVLIPMQTDAGVEARFARLYWPHSRRDFLQPEPPPQKPTPDWVQAIDPRDFPPLHLVIQDTRFGQARLGQAEFTSAPVAAGMEIKQFDTRSDAVTMAAKGTWLKANDSTRTSMQMDLTTENLGHMLDALDFTDALVGGTADTRIRAEWPGSPADIDWGSMQGTLKLAIKNGRVPQVSPGLGRLLGLISVGDLPRRLSFSFGDILRKGFSFKTVTGDIQLEQGLAHSDNLVMDGSAATISIKGEADLLRQTLDQTVEIMPHVGNSLPLIGAMVGGPVGAAAGLAVQGVMGKGVNKAAASVYHLSGSFADPEFERMDKPDAAPPPDVKTQPKPQPETNAKPQAPDVPGIRHEPTG